MMEGDFEDKIELSGNALAALQAFYSEREEREQEFERLKSEAEEKESGADGSKAKSKKPLSMEAFTEDWNVSQFWYSQETATVLANQLLEGATKDTNIAVISAPSAFVQLKNILDASEIPADSRPNLHLLEFDQRFDVFPEFVFYDFHHPMKLPPSMKGSIDHIICDPPFLSEDCQTKAAMTVRWLLRSTGVGNTTPSRLIVCTGERMETLINKLYRQYGIATTTYEPIHAKGLSNEFYCYANFSCSDWDRRVDAKAGGAEGVQGSGMRTTEGGEDELD